MTTTPTDSTPGCQRNFGPGVLILALVIILFSIAGSLYMHLTLGTSLDQTEEIWEERTAYHREVHPVSTRPLTTGIMDFLHTNFGIDYLTSFIVLQYILALFLGLAFFYYLKSLGFSGSFTNLGVLLLMTSYPILCAHFQPVYTWDDFWQYLALVGAFTFIVRERLFLASITFALGIVARDATILCYPLFFIAVLTACKAVKREKLISAIFPAIVWFIFLYLTWETPIERRWHHFEVNFADLLTSTNTLLSLALSFGFMWLTALAASTLLGGRLIQKRNGRIVLLGAMLFIPITVITTLTLTLARETRIFFPPFIFVIPLTLWLIEEYSESIKQFYRKAYFLPGIIWLAISVQAGIWIVNFWYPDGLFRASPPATKAILSINIALALALLGPIFLTLVRTPYRSQNRSAAAISNEESRRAN